MGHGSAGKGKAAERTPGSDLAAADHTPMLRPSARIYDGNPERDPNETTRRSRSPPRGPPPPPGSALRPAGSHRRDPEEPNTTSSPSLPSSWFVESSETGSSRDRDSDCSSSFSLILQAGPLDDAKAFLQGLYSNQLTELQPGLSTRSRAGKLAWYQRDVASASWQTLCEKAEHYLQGSWLVQWQNWKVSHARGRRKAGEPRE